MVINILKDLLPVHIRILPHISYAVPTWCHPPDSWFYNYELYANFSWAPPFHPSSQPACLNSCQAHIPQYLVYMSQTRPIMSPFTNHASSLSLICNMVAQFIPLVTEAETSHPRLPSLYFSHLSPNPVFLTEMYNLSLCYSHCHCLHSGPIGFLLDYLEGLWLVSQTPWPTPYWNSASRKLPKRMCETAH